MAQTYSSSRPLSPAAEKENSNLKDSFLFSAGLVLTLVLWIIKVWVIQVVWNWLIAGILQMPLINWLQATWILGIGWLFIKLPISPSISADSFDKNAWRQVLLKFFWIALAYLLVTLVAAQLMGFSTSPIERLWPR